MVTDIQSLGNYSNIIIAGHQYCDNDYSGTNNGCDESVFNSSYWCNWIKYIEDTLKSTGIKWFLTEGGVSCGLPNTKNCKLYYDFLSFLQSKSPSCLGFTTWLMAPVTSSTPNNTQFGPYKNWIAEYSNLEPYPKNGQLYDFSKFERTTISLPNSCPKPPLPPPGPPGPPSKKCPPDLSPTCGAQIIQAPDDHNCFYKNGIIKPECSNKCKILKQDLNSIISDKCFRHDNPFKI